MIAAVVLVVVLVIGLSRTSFLSSPDPIDKGDATVILLFVCMAAMMCFTFALLAVEISAEMVWLDTDRPSDTTSFRASSIVVEDGERAKTEDRVWAGEMMLL